VLEAENPGTALELIDTDADIKLLFTDVVMPDMNGRRLSEAPIARRPGLKVLFTTGYTRNAIVHNGMLDPDVNLLSKPFTLDQLARKIADVLKGQP
jgi:DNA-binding NtrC family response regulator